LNRGEATLQRKLQDARASVPVDPEPAAGVGDEFELAVPTHEHRYLAVAGEEDAPARQIDRDDVERGRDLPATQGEQEIVRRAGRGAIADTLVEQGDGL